MTIAPSDRDLFRLSLSQYHKMVRAGVLGEDDPVELLQGVLITKLSKSAAHRMTTRLVRGVLEAGLDRGWYVDTQEPITLGDSEPEPDVVVVRGVPRDYPLRHPGAEEVGLIVEVADSSLERDRSWKGRIYAEAGIPEYWIVNLPEQCLERHTSPDSVSGSYRVIERFTAEESFPFGLPGGQPRTLPVRQLLP